MSPYESWSDRQIREAQERGEFDNLPGAGRPIPGLNGRDDENWWLKSFLEREKIAPVLPESLAFRKEIEDLPDTLAEVRTEAAAREIVEDLNRRIVDARRPGMAGPKIFIRTVDVDAALARWRTR